MPGKDQQPRRTRTFVAIACIVLLALIAGMLGAMRKPATETKQLSSSEFIEQVRNDKVANAQLDPRTQTATGLLDNGSTYQASFGDFPITEELTRNDVPFDIQSQKSSSMPLLLIFGLLAFVGVLILFNRSRNAGSKSTQGVPGRLIEAGEIPVSFADVAGCDEVVQELAEIKGFLSDPEKFRRLGASIPKGVLLFGPPGTGKTLLARAVAGEANVPFFSISGSDFVEMYVGVGASRVRKLFESAKQQAPCVIFIDEIDAVGRKRGSSSQGGQEERENTLNQLLVEIDGFAPSDNVIVMAASNRADILDPALTRPGRFDRQVIVDSPDRNGRRAILDVHGKGKPFGSDVDLDAVAGQTAGFCGADLANLVNEAALLAARSDRDSINAFDIDEAIMRVMAGPQKNRLMSPREKLVTAAHEMGHAIVAHELPDAEPVHKVTIVGRGRALGLTVMLQEEDKLLRTRTELMSQMAVALGGRAAEELMFTEITSGASNDLEKVNEIAQTMVLKLGMVDEFALRSYMKDDRVMVHSETLSTKIDDAVDRVVREAKVKATQLLEARRDELERLTDLLIERETIDRKEFEALMAGRDPREAEAQGEIAKLEPAASASDDDEQNAGDQSAELAA